MRRPGPDSKVVPIISPRQGTSGKSSLEKRKVSPTCFRIDSAKSRKIYSVVKKVNFARDTAKSDVGMQITKFSKEMEETNWGKKFLEIVQYYKFPLEVDPTQVKVLLKDLLQEGDYMINIPNSKDDSIQ